MPVGEVCDESLNDRANQGGWQRQCSENMAGTAFIEAAKTWQSRKGEFIICPVWITVLNSVTLYGEQHLLNSVAFHIIEKNYAKPQNRPCQV